MNIVSFLNLNLAAEILHNTDGTLHEDVIEGSVIKILEIKINPSVSDNSVEKLSTSINCDDTENKKCEPDYVNSNVDNSYLKVSVHKAHLSVDGIRLSVKILWNIVKDDRPTEDWIGFYRIGTFL